MVGFGSTEAPKIAVSLFLETTQTNLFVSDSIKISFAWFFLYDPSIVEHSMQYKLAYDIHDHIELKGVGEEDGHAEIIEERNYQRIYRLGKKLPVDYVHDC
jgi:hypothetical protein